MALARPHQRRRAEPLIALINVVFLLLIFVLIAGSVAAPLVGDLELVEAEEVQTRSPPDAAVVLADGTLLFRGESVSPEAYAEARLSAGEAELRIVPDRNLPATRLVGIVSSLRSAGAAQVWIVTERGLP